MSSTPDPQQPPSSSEGSGTPGSGDPTPAEQQTGPAAQPSTGAPPPEQPAYYRPGPSSGYYPQYPQNPYGGGRTPSYAQPQYGQPAVPPQYGQAPYAQPGYGGAPGTGWAGPVSRPPTMIVSLVLLLLAALPFLVGGLAVSIAPLTEEMFPPEAGLEQLQAQAGIGFAEIVSLFRTLGVVMAVLAAVYMVLAVVAFTGRAGARLALTVLTVLFGLFLLVALVGSLGNPLSLAVPLLVLVASVAGVALMFGAPAKAWFASRRT